MGLGDRLPFEVAKRVVPRLPRSMQRFNPSASWAAASARSIGYGVAASPSNAADATRRNPLSGNDTATIAALGTALTHVNSTDRAIRVVDFGGANGNHAVLADSVFAGVNLDWCVVELPNVVESMQAHARPGLTFLTDLNEALDRSPDITFASASLNYVSEPFVLLDRLLASSAVTVLTRLPLWPISHHQVAVQRPQRRPVEISYPTWFFSETRFLAEAGASADLLLDFVCPDDRAAFAGHYGMYRGLVLSQRPKGRPSAR